MAGLSLYIFCHLSFSHAVVHSVCSDAVSWPTGTTSGGPRA